MWIVLKLANMQGINQLLSYVAIKTKNNILIDHPQIFLGIGQLTKCRISKCLIGESIEALIYSSIIFSNLARFKPCFSREHACMTQSTLYFFLFRELLWCSVIPIFLLFDITKITTINYFYCFRTKAPLFLIWGYIPSWKQCERDKEEVGKRLNRLTYKHYSY